jgi:hypothetical protein
VSIDGEEKNVQDNLSHAEYRVSTYSFHVEIDNNTLSLIINISRSY